MADDYTCGFCGKGLKDVCKMVTSSTGACICDECVIQSFQVMIENRSKPKPALSLQSRLFTKGGSDEHQD